MSIFSKQLWKSLFRFYMHAIYRTVHNQLCIMRLWRSGWLRGRYNTTRCHHRNEQLSNYKTNLQAKSINIVNINYPEIYCTFSSVAVFDKRYVRKIIQLPMTGCIQYDCEFLTVYPQYDNCCNKWKTFQKHLYISCWN